MGVVSLATLKESKIIPNSVKKVKIFGTFDLESKLTVEGIKVTKGAKASIEKAGGTVVEVEKNIDSNDVKKESEK
jgi:large subunit ribosomal protein L15